MSEGSQEGTPTEPAAQPEPARQDPQQPQQPTPPAEPEDKTDWRAEARKWEQRAKENRDAARELERQRQASMTESERALAEAKATERATVVAEFGKRLARAEIRSAAAAANKDVAGVFDYLDLSRFVTEDGEPDAKEIGAFVAALKDDRPKVPSFDGGSRADPKTTDMNDLVRQMRNNR